MNARSQLGSGELRGRLRAFDPHRQSWSSWTPLLDRLGFLIDYRGPDVCSRWCGGLDAYGYGQVGFAGRRLKVHRIVYELSTGRTLGPDEDVDHVCHNRAVALGECAGGPRCPHRACCNPLHLIASTRRDNVLAGVGRSAANARKTHCPLGHPYEGDNLYVHQGHRHCKACMLKRNDLRKKEPA